MTKFASNSEETEEATDKTGSSVRNLPDFLICGIHKGGTSALNAFVKQHPDVVIAVRGAYLFERSFVGRTAPHALCKEESVL